MSLAFSNAALQSGIVERLRRKVGVDTNPDAYPLEEIVSDVNSALDSAFEIIFKSGGKWMLDDSNQTDQPIIMTDLVANQRDYSFSVDGAGNLILDIFKVLIADSYGFYRESKRVDPKSEKDTQQFWNALNVVGIPYRHALQGNSILVDPIPNYSTNGAVTGKYGIKMYINRESTYFTATDTAKMPGIAGILHEYFVLHPAYSYASRNNLEIAGGVLRNGSITGLLREVSLMEAKIENYYGSRGKDFRSKLMPRITKFK